MSTYRKDYPEHWFVVDYELTETKLNMTAWKISALDEAGSAHELEEPAHLVGYIKWDGCTDFNFDSGIHFCGSDIMEQHCALLRELYKEAQRVFNDPTL